MIRDSLAGYVAAPRGALDLDRQTEVSSIVEPASDATIRPEHGGEVAPQCERVSGRPSGDLKFRRDF
jgi:hypothetical protein